MVAQDLIATASHCVPNKENCAGYLWVFDYRVERNRKLKDIVPATDVYACKEVLVSVLEKQSGADYALVRLDRAVVGRNPLAIHNGKVDKKSELVEGIVVRGEDVTRISHLAPYLE